MGTYLQDSQLLYLKEGRVLSQSVTFGAAATTTIFTVVTGNVLVTNLYGVVTTAIGSTATTLEFGTAPTLGTAEHAGISTATAITSSEVGVWVIPSVSTNIAGALVVGGHAGNVVYNNPSFPVAPGGVTITTSANPGAGVMKFYLAYVPLDAGAYVTVL